MMYGIRIDDTDTLRRWGLVLLDGVSVGMPAQKTSFLDIPGANGVLDLSTALTGGEPVFENRQISMELMAARKILDRELNEEYFDRIYREFCNRYHGQKCRLQLPNDRKHYFCGRVEVGQKSAAYNVLKFAVTMDADPVRYAVDETTMQSTVAASGTAISVYNPGRRVIPSFKCTAAVTLVFNSTGFSLPANTETKFPGLYLDNGPTTITARNGAGTLTVSFREETM